MRSSNFIIMVLLLLVINTKGISSSLYEKGHEYYEKENYGLSIEYYDSLIRLGHLDANLFYNTGNAYFQNGNLGLAILHYKKALKLHPGHEKAKNNLSIASSKTLDKIEEQPSTLFQWLLIQTSVLSPNNWAIITIIFSILLLVLVFLFKKSQQVKMKRIFFYSGAIVFIVFFFSLTLTIITSRSIKKIDEAVIISKVVDVKTSPAENSETIFTLHEGAVTNILNLSENWVEISVNQGNIGWIHKSDLELVQL